MTQQNLGHAPPEPRPAPAPRASIHEGVTECDDPICCCEPEPRWREVAAEMELASEESPRAGDAFAAGPRSSTAPVSPAAGPSGPRMDVAETAAPRPSSAVSRGAYRGCGRPL
jgi:hypothetical protein